MLLSLNQYIQNQWILSGGHYYIVEAINAKKKVKKNQMYKITSSPAGHILETQGMQAV